MPTVTQDIVTNLRRCGPTLLLCAVVLAVLPRLLDRDGSGTHAGLYVAMLFILYPIMRMIVFDVSMSMWGRATDTGGRVLPPDNQGRFAFVLMGFAVLSILPAIIMGYQVLDGTGYSRGEMVLATVVIGYLLAWVLLALFGTQLPATIDHQPFAPSRAVQAIRATWFTTLPQLTVLALLPGLAVQIGFLFLRGWQNLYPMPAMLVMAIAAVLWLLALGTATIGGVILTRAYRAGWSRLTAPTDTRPSGNSPA
jgi:hypothetical protein